MDQQSLTTHVLLIDDEPFMLSLLGQQLADLGLIDIHSYLHATEAIAFLEAHPGQIDLIICDLQMPTMDGIECIRHLARISYRGGLILASGEDVRILDTALRLAQAQQLDVLGGLTKPVTQAQLREVLEHPASPIATGQVERGAFSPAEVRRALTGGELVNHFQPKVDIASGEVVGMEALVRWQHPQEGLVYPDRFVDTAERYGLISDLTHWVLSNALSQTRQWLKAGLNLSIAVNVSMENLIDLDFVEQVTRTVADTGTPIENLVLEVTESRVMQDAVAAQDILTRLRLRHVALSIDDFGTGHSSLAKLRDMPFNELKIDRGFLHGADRDASMRSIFEASLRMAQQFGMRTVAEGVEDREDWDFLCSSDCDLAQGYFISRPMPPDQVPAWVKSWDLRRAKLIAEHVQ